MTYSLTKIKTFLGREGYGLNATICKDGKPVAFACDDASGGDMDVDFTNPLQTAASYNATKALREQNEKDCLAWALDWYTNSPEAEGARTQHAELVKQFPAADRPMTAREALVDWINATLDAQELAKKQAAQLKRWAKTQTVFRIKGDEAGTYRTLKSPATDPRAIPAIVKKYGFDQIDMIYGVDLATLKVAA